MTTTETATIPASLMTDWGRTVTRETPTRPIRDGETDTAYLKRAARWCREEYRRLRPTFQGHPSHVQRVALENTAQVFTYLADYTHGVEGDAELDVMYLNTGDTYGETLVYHGSRLCVTSWGAVAESNMPAW